MFSVGIRSSANFTTAFKRFKHEYAPRFGTPRKAHKGRVPVRTGGSVKGNSVEFGEFGLRLKSEGTRLTAKQLKEADNVIMRVVRSSSGKIWRRLVTAIPVCIKGNETRMGKGKGAFDHWMARVPTGKVIFEVSGIHPKTTRDVFRKAAAKLPGVYEVVKKGDLVRVGLKHLVPKPKKQIVELKPSKEAQNVLKSKQDEYRLYRGR